MHYKPPAPSRPMTPTYLHPVSQPVFAAHVVERPPTPYTRPRAPQTTTYVQRPPHQFAQLDAIQDLIDQGLVNLGQLSVTTNPLPAHSTHAVSPSSGDIHHIDLIEDDSIHVEPCTIQFDPDEAPFQLTHPTPLIVTRSGRIAQPPPPAVRPFEGTTSHEEVRREDDEVLRQLQSTQARISIWSLLASSSTHRDALIRALNDDLPPDGLDHVRPLYITVGCSGRRVPSVLLDNGSALNVCPLATAIALGFAPSDFGPSTQTVRAYDSTKREVMGTLMIDLQIGPATFSTLFQVLRIPTFLTCYLADLDIAGAIPSSLHQKVKFIHDGQTLEIEDFHRDFVAMSFDQIAQWSGYDEDEFGDYFVRGSETRPRLEEIDSGFIQIERPSLASISPATVD
ncbi:hypothetical protein CK203_059466 [Vitis vinifera]|uniref:Uncharacterized protein n=1 Tax=Vitis vinifera TaxID=29760 RepID=A0A438GBS3_VITVI|nr:hypothetical protein CK203_059466 [Vitis vinifera]